MTGTYAACLHTNQSRSFLNHLVRSLLVAALLVSGVGYGDRNGREGVCVV